MFYKKLGRTGLSVSSLALGTVSIGVDYGIEVPGEFGTPEEVEAITLLKTAADGGINLFDTAPAYGRSELCLGEAVGARSDCLIATKVPIPYDSRGMVKRGKKLRDALHASLETSLINLHRDCLDIVQIHNATIPVLRDGGVAQCLLKAKDKGVIHCIGASVYTEAEALLAIEEGSFDVLQVAYNILDQRMAGNVFPAAEHAGVGIIVRSALLKGVLTRKSEWLPPELEELRKAALRAKGVLSGTWEALPHMALRFCQSAPEVSSVLVGVRTQNELKEALSVTDAGPLPESILSTARELALSDDHLLDPRYWPIK